MAHAADPDMELVAQEAYFEAVGVIGKVGGPPPTKREIDDAIYKAVGFRPRGILQYTKGKFLATFALANEAKQACTAQASIQDRPIMLSPWTVDGSENLDRLDVPQYWLKLPGLPAHYFKSISRVASRVGTVVREKFRWDELLNGAVPTVCVQIPDINPLPDRLPLPKRASGTRKRLSSHWCLQICFIAVTAVGGRGITIASARWQLNLPCTGLSRTRLR